MSDVEQVLREYIREHRAGGAADPREFLARIDDRTERLELEALIDAYLERTPRASVQIDALRAPAAELLVDRIQEELGESRSTWHELLPTLRMNARLKRSELVERLTSALDVAGREPKVARYYNAMEHEQLEPTGVSSKVFEALAAILKTSAAALREAAPRQADAPPAPSVAYARLAPWDADAEAVAASPAQAPELEWDEVDELFRGG